GIRQIRKDSLEFYLTTRMRTKVQIALPGNWENSWHHVVAGYDGKSIYLTIDENESMRKPVTGNIRNTPFPVNIGRNAEIHGQETTVYICDAIIDQVSIFNKVVAPGELKPPSSELKKEAILWLEFEEMKEQGNFFSYGIGARTYGSIWPDRRPQPEMWQIKKSGQPVNVKLVSADRGEIEIINRYHFTNLNELRTIWILSADAEIIDKGEISPDIPPQERGIMTVPYRKPELKEGAEYRLLIGFYQKGNTQWAEDGFEIAWEQIGLPWIVNGQKSDRQSVNLLTVQEEDKKLKLSGKDFEYIFDESTGILASLKVSGREMIKRGAALNVWRAPLANETDEWNYRSSNTKHRTDGYGRFAASEWYSAGLHSLKTMTEDFTFSILDNNNVEVKIRNVVLLANGRGGFINRYRYLVSGEGEMIIEHSVIPNGDTPAWLPRIGLEWILSPSLKNVEWYGRGPQENYPDRKNGYRIGVYKSTVKDMYEPYLIPQDHGLRTDNRWVRMTGDDGTGLEFGGDKPFNFNAYPFSTDNLTKAYYTYQLRPFDGITFNFDYATSGVGCTALSVFPEYQVMPQRFDFTVKIKPVNPLR
ncbi:MAG: DUF4981 domain-containing protein, partial [Bacteroidales bacterium]|nr:DUF4981 domain-containing protein [Bacteroidales bacterium]